MLVRIAAFTSRGVDLACRIAECLRSSGDDVVVWAPSRLAEAGDVEGFSSLAQWVADAFGSADGLVFVSACGIAVRAIAPYVSDKLSDPAVVCVDERGRHVVSLLSGHVGGANALARTVASATGGEAVITTATDVEGIFAVDEWAASQGLVMLDRDVAKRISAVLLEGGEVGLVSAWSIEGCVPTGIVTGERALSCELGISISLDAGQLPFKKTLRLVPRVVTVGIGCKRGTSEERIAAQLERCLKEACVEKEAVCAIATIDVKADEEAISSLAQHLGVGVRLYTADELRRVEGTFSSSEFVLRTVGVDNVCERAACADGQELMLARRSKDGVTMALGAARPCLSFRNGSSVGSPVPRRSRNRTSDGAPVPPGAMRLTCVGLGPGAHDDLTARARAALDEAEVIVGYRTYVELIRDEYPEKELVATPMRTERERCRLALSRAAEGSRVALVCSGDPGIYGMAGLVLELSPDYPGVEVEVIAGVTAANGGAAVLGAPLMHDWCSISLSDLMTSWELIERRLEAAAQADFCICLYNPASHGRPDHLRRACDVLLRWRDPKTVCGYVRNIGREGQTATILSLEELREKQVDMLTCVFVGNSQTRTFDGRMVTPRGYRREGA